jgi:Cu(I)/Ag(I) efflux system membrane fusion protein
MRQVIALFLLLGVAAYAQHDNGHGQQKESPKGHAMISVPTIQCETCVQTVETAVKKVQGVKSVSVDLEKKIAHVNFNPAKTNQQKIENAIAAAGYDANKTKRDEVAHAKLPKCCQSERK